MTKIRLVLADDHTVVRAGLSMVLSAQPDLEVVGEAADGFQALIMVEKTKPDVLILDFTMPGMSGVELIERLQKESPGTRVLVLTMHDEPAYMRAVLAAGGAGYLVKTAGDAELLSAIRAVAQGRLFVDLSLPADAASPLPAPKVIHRAPSAGLAGLSERERTVFELLAQGYTNQQTADRMFLSVKTVETYRSRIANKLGIHTRAELIRFAVESGMLKPVNKDSGSVGN
jgi:two-component system response regulator NreC